jgi:hypothetical protein
MSQKNLDHVSLIVPVIDLAHVGPTLVNLNSARSSYPVDHLDIQIEVDPSKFPGSQRFCGRPEDHRRRHRSP